MLDQLTFTGRELLLAIVLATLIYLLEVLLFSRRRKRGVDAALESRVRELELALVAQEGRLAALEARPRADTALDRQADTHAEAVRLAREGLSAGEVAERLGISLTEAELIIALRRAES